MASTTMLRTETSGPTGSSAQSSDDTAGLAAFRAGRPDEERLVDLLAYALGAEKGQPAVPEAVEGLRREASKALSEHAFRYLHNSVEQIRREAVTEHLGALRRPPGFFRLILANLVALAVGALIALGLAPYIATMAGLSGLMTG